MTRQISSGSGSTATRIARTCSTVVQLALAKPASCLWPLQYVHYPHYRALILRKTYADLSLPDAIMDRAISWWDGVEGARFNNQEKVCYFPSGAKITFGYLASVRDHLRYQGAAVHFVGIDEASQIPSRQLEYLHSRIRRAIGDPIPLRYRLASNPGDVSHDWLHRGPLIAQVVADTG